MTEAEVPLDAVEKELAALREQNKLFTETLQTLHRAVAFLIKDVKTLKEKSSAANSSVIIKRI